VLVNDPPARGEGAFEAGGWIVEPELNCLRKGNLEQRVEPKVMKVLLTLAAHPNHVVSKENLIATVWPDTFVSDDVLTRCISILRRITGDDPHAPRFIQTVPKAGYRLVAPISEIAAVAAATHPEAPSANGRSAPIESALLGIAEAPPGSAVEPGPLANGRIWVVVAIAVAIILIVLTGFWLWNARHPRGEPAVFRSFRTVQFTSSAGEQTQPAFSADGRRIAFVRIAEDGGSRRIYLKQIGRESESELTPVTGTYSQPGNKLASEAGEQQFSPAWSPDSRQIAYLAESKSGLGLYIAEPGSGRPARKVYTPQEPSHWEQGALSWSPDGRTLIFPDHVGSQPDSCIFALDLGTGKARPISTPPAGWEGDLNPAYSPDGRRIAFTRASETAVRDIYWMDAGGGPLHRLTHDRMDIDGLAWSTGSDAIVFSSNRGGKYGLWTMALNASRPVRLPVGAEDAFQPAIGPRPGQLAYAQGLAIWSIVRIEGGSGHPAEERPVLASTEQDSAPSLSPDGRYFAFQSLRSGSQQIWIAALDGGSLRQLTFTSGPLTGSPSWSSDGKRILFDSRPDGHSHIFMVSAAGGSPKQLTFGNANDIVPRWSHDDQFVYYRSNRGGEWQLWRVAIAGGQPQQITTNDGIEPQESADGKWVYFTRGDDDGIWRVPASGGPETRVLWQPASGYWGYWQLTPRSIFYLDVANGSAVIRTLDLSTGLSTNQSQVYATLKQIPPPYAGLSVAENVVLATEERDAGRHITLVEAQ
jgi:Tol biopolymer transport system component/DNA-binding winged helix-turn-helix (wHTH) protein